MRLPRFRSSGEGPTYYGITLPLPTQTDGIGTTATLTAAVATPGGVPAPGVPLTFQVTEGPDAGSSFSAITDLLGHAKLLAMEHNARNRQQPTATVTANATTFTSNIATVQWIGIPTTLIYTGPTTGEWATIR